MGKVSFLEKELVITSNEVLLRALLGSGLSLALAGRGWNAKAYLTGPYLVRFVGGCLASGYGLSDFGVEVVSGVQIEHEKLRVLKEGSTNDRGLIRLSPEEFIFLGLFCSKGVEYTTVDLDFQRNFVSLRREDYGFVLRLVDAKGLQEQVLLSQKSDILRFFSALFASALGREKQAQRIAGEDNYVKVKEKVEIKDDLNKVIQLPIKTANGNTKLEEKTLSEWLSFIHNTAQTAGKSPQAVLKSFLKKHNILYSCKVSLTINNVEVRIPSHWALGLYQCFEKYL